MGASLTKASVAAERMHAFAHRKQDSSLYPWRDHEPDVPIQFRRRDSSEPEALKPH